MGHIKGILKEELKNSKEMKKSYEKLIKELPKGSISVMKRKGKEYCYLKVREGDKVKNIYKGKMAAEEIAQYGNVKRKRAKYRTMLSKVKKQIKYLKGALRGKESI